jgi:serine/threonine protein phosphatase PrpC
MQDGRVNGLLRVSRSFGDLPYKAVDKASLERHVVTPQSSREMAAANRANVAATMAVLHAVEDGHAHQAKQMICTPDFRDFVVQEGDEFIVIGNAVVWKAFSNQEAVNLVR